MRYFIGYHNEQKMGYSCINIPTPRLRTEKPVGGLEGSTVWVIAGEDKTPKNFYLAAKFSIQECAADKHPGTQLFNEVSGPGILLGKSIFMNGTPLLAQLQKLSANFRSGFCELQDASAITGLHALTR